MHIKFWFEKLRVRRPRRIWDDNIEMEEQGEKL
jgi:hypothetical protein